MENENSLKSRKIIKISRSKLKKVVFVLVILAIIGILISRSNTRRYMGGYATGMPAVPISQDSGVNYNKEMLAPDYYRYQKQNPSVEDTREFMKVNYGANIKTRDVRSMMRDARSVIRDAEGRIDQINENKKGGEISFVIPKSNFDKFKDDIESITNSKLIIENISSENLLPEKQSIEERQGAVSDILASLEAQKKDLITKHNAKVKETQRAIDELSAQVEQIDLILPKLTDQVQKSTLIEQRGTLVDNITLLKGELSNENSTYNATSKNLKAQIDSMTAQSNSIKRQDSNLMENVETVNGNIYVRWVSLWELAKIFSPVHPTIAIIVLVVLSLFVLYKTKVLPKVEFV